METMELGWPYVHSDIKRTFITKEVYEFIEKSGSGKHFHHEIIYWSNDLPKRIELGDAIETNAYHLLFYMIARFYFFDNGQEIIYYYPNKHNNLLPEKALGSLPSRFKRELVKRPEYEYIEMPACTWTTVGIDEPWIYSYVRDLYKDIWNSTTQIKGKYTYISRNRRDIRNRRVLNEDDLKLPLKRLGFSLYNLDSLTFEEQIRLFRSSEFVTGLHGAGFAWLIFCCHGTVFCEIDDPADRKLCFQDVAVKCGLKYYCFTDVTSVENTEFPEARDDDILINKDTYLHALEYLITDQVGK